jgi:hypothetical protein
MSEGEQRIADTRGRFVKAVQNGQQIDDANWTVGRIRLSNKRLVLAEHDPPPTDSVSAAVSTTIRATKSAIATSLIRAVDRSVPPSVCLSPQLSHLKPSHRTDSRPGQPNS